MQTTVLDQAPSFGPDLHPRMRGADRLAPMRGLMIGLVLSSALWTAIAKIVF